MVVSAAAETSRSTSPTRKPAAVPTSSRPVPRPLFCPPSGGASSAKRSTTTISSSPPRSASGDLGGFQGGIDLLRGSLIAGQYERAGLYGAYGDVQADVNGLVTNPAATAYVLTHTGSMNLNPWSAGGYFGRIPGLVVGISTPCCKGPWHLAWPAPSSRGSTPTARASLPPGGRLSIRLAATRAGVRDRATGADSMAEGVLPARL